ncbi:MAG: sigma-70 family RNA polymerase sigma factor, partial [Myxococcota bacterium]
DDIVQDVMIRALHSVKSLNDPALMRPWLRQITINQVRMELRKRKTRRRSEHQEYVDQRSSDGIQEQELHEQRQLLRAVYAIIDQLPVEERLAFILRRIEGLPLDDIAEQLECSLATVKRRLRKAFARFERLAVGNPALRQLLGEES